MEEFSPDQLQLDQKLEAIEDDSSFASFVDHFASLPLLSDFSYEKAAHYKALNVDRVLLAEILEDEDPDGKRLLEVVDILQRVNEGTYSDKSPEALQKAEEARDLFDKAHAVVSRERAAALRDPMHGPWNTLHKHLTDYAERLTQHHDRRGGPDVRASLDPAEFCRYIIDVYGHRVTQEEINKIVRDGTLIARASQLVAAVNYGWKPAELEPISLANGSTLIGLKTDLEFTEDRYADSGLAAQYKSEVNKQAHSDQVGAQSDLIELIRYAQEHVDSSTNFIQGYIEAEIDMAKEAALIQIEVLLTALGAKSGEYRLIPNEDLSKLDEIVSVFQYVEEAGIAVPDTYTEVMNRVKELYMHILAVDTLEERRVEGYVTQLNDIYEKYALSASKIRAHPEGRHLLQSLKQGFGRSFKGLDDETAKLFAGISLTLFDGGEEALHTLLSEDTPFEYQMHESWLHDRLDDLVLWPYLEWLREQADELSRLGHEQEVLYSIAHSYYEYLKELEEKKQTDIEDTDTVDETNTSAQSNAEDSESEPENDIFKIDEPTPKEGVFANARTDKQVLDVLIRIQKRASLSEVFSFPASKKQLQEDLEAEKKTIKRAAQKHEVEIDWNKIDALIDLMDSFEETEEFAGELFRTKSGSLNTIIPYYILELEHIDTGERYVIAETPQEDNATYMFSESQFQNMPWKEIVSFSKDDVRASGGVRVVHAEGSTISDHFKRVKDRFYALVARPSA